MNSQDAVTEGSSPAVARWCAGEQPFVFAYADLWQHPDPLLDVLKGRYGSRPLDSFGGSYGWSVRYRQVEDYAALGLRTLGDYIDRFRLGTVKLPYLRHLSINRAMPELRRFLTVPREFTPNWVSHPLLDRLGGPELFIGQAGTSFGHLHQDHASVHVGFIQLQGRKQFVLFPPGDGQYLDIFEGRQFPYQLRNSRIRYCDLDNLARFPLLEYASPRRITLDAGQALFMPADWWHTTLNLTDSVSFSIRIVNRSNAGRTLMRHIEGIPRALHKFRAGLRRGPQQPARSGA